MAFIKNYYNEFTDLMDKTGGKRKFLLENFYRLLTKVKTELSGKEYWQ